MLNISPTLYMCGPSRWGKKSRHAPVVLGGL